MGSTDNSNKTISEPAQVLEDSMPIYKEENKVDDKARKTTTQDLDLQMPQVDDDDDDDSNDPQHIVYESACFYFVIV